VRLSNPAFHRGATVLRRPYSFDDGIDPVTGARDAGLFFLAYVADLDRQLIPVQQALGERDRLNEVSHHRRQPRLRRPAGCRAGCCAGAEASHLTADPEALPLHRA